MKSHIAFGKVLSEMTNAQLAAMECFFEATGLSFPLAVYKRKRKAPVRDKAAHAKRAFRSNRKVPEFYPILRISP